MDSTEWHQTDAIPPDLRPISLQADLVEVTMNVNVTH
jgi:hypothetical protein